jgi:hypothetical protein
MTDAVMALFAFRAKAANFQIDFGGAKSGWQFHVHFWLHIVEAESLPAGVACEVRVRMIDCFSLACAVNHKTPHPIIARNAMRDADAYQPIQHAINSDAINCVMLRNGGGNIQMRNRMIAGEKSGQHRHSRISHALTRRAQYGFGFRDFGEVGGFHLYCFVDLRATILALARG